MIDTEKPIGEITSFANMMSAKMAGMNIVAITINLSKF